MHILVVGASGYIGSEIYSQLSLSNYNIYGTTYTHGKKGDLFPFDMCRDSIKDKIPQNKDLKKIAVICSAISSIDYCRLHRDEAYYLNVVRTKKLLDELIQLGYKPVFISTDQVFDGKSGNYTETSQVTPINQYGCMKAEIENYLQETGADFCILRLGKIIGTQLKPKNLLFDMLDRAKKGEDLICIRGNIGTFTDVKDIAKAFEIIAENNVSGIYHITSDNILSRTALAEKFAFIMGLNTKIIEKELESFHFIDNRPLITYLNNRKFADEFEFKYRSIDEIILDFKGENDRCK